MLEKFDIFSKYGKRYKKGTNVLFLLTQNIPIYQKFIQQNVLTQLIQPKYRKQILF